jgi:hypothetical protein
VWNSPLMIVPQSGELRMKQHVMGNLREPPATSFQNRHVTKRLLCKGVLYQAWGHVLYRVLNS